MEPVERTHYAGALEKALLCQVLDAWYPRALDRAHPGFLTDFSYRFEPFGPQHKMIVTQSRHLWTLSKVAPRYTERTAAYLAMAANGLAQLEGQWDSVNGGFHEHVTREGTPMGDGIKTAYGHAFAIFGLAQYHKATGDQRALRLARDAFRWLELHSYDAQHGGYFQFIESSGIPLKEGHGRFPPKDQNSSIHLLESFVELYGVWPNSHLAARLGALLRLIAETMTAQGKYLRLFFTPDWVPVPYALVQDYEIDHVSFGHDVETAYLLLEASRALGGTDSTARTVARSMLEHALSTGWDSELGGFYERGFYAGSRCTIIADAKVWWAQFEALNTLLLMGMLFPEERARYHEYFRRLWEYINKYLFCPQYGGCYWAGLDTRPEHAATSKGEQWKGPYHTVRGLLGAIDLLR